MNVRRVTMLRKIVIYFFDVKIMSYFTITKLNTGERIRKQVSISRSSFKIELDKDLSIGPLQ